MIKQARLNIRFIRCQRMPWFFAGVILLLGGCLGTAEKEVVVYAALDREFSEPILSDFESSSGITVLGKYDQESNKTVGLANELMNQQNRQRGDLFWNNEILHTLRLKEQGLLESFECEEASNYPSQFVSKDSDWFGFAARARVLIINKEVLGDEANWPDSLNDLIEPQWKGKCAMARPLFGTTATQAAVMFSEWGEDKAKAFFEKVAENVEIESGNKQVAQKVASGQYAFGMTDTDDAVIELDRGAPVAIVFPDQGADQSGTLLIPNTLAVMKGGPNTEHAKQLVRHLLSVEIETRLAEGASAQLPLHQQCKVVSRVSTIEKIKAMEVDFEAAAKVWDQAAAWLQEKFPVAE